MSKRGHYLKSTKITKTIAAIFPSGVQKEAIQQWRHARPRPGEKETHNIKLREQMVGSADSKYRCVVKTDFQKISLYSKSKYVKIRCTFKHCLKAFVSQKIRKITKNIAAIFPRGLQKRKSNNGDKHGHGQEKKRPTA